MALGTMSGTGTPVSCSRTCSIADRVVGAERDQPSVRGDLLHAAFHQLFDVEGVGILEVLDDDGEDPVGEVREGLGQVDPAALGAVQAAVARCSCAVMVSVPGTADADHKFSKASRIARSGITRLET